MNRRTAGWGTAIALLITVACDNPSPETPSAGEEETPVKKVFEETREACEDRNPLRNVYFGDLHVHTRLSFDAWAYDVRVGPVEAYRFAKGESVFLPPLDTDGKGTREVRLARPLDFAAITDHAELLAETQLCADPESAAYDVERCQNYNQGGGEAVDALALVLGSEDPVRWPEICDREGVDCSGVADQLWTELKLATEQAYDTSSACTFTAFHGYEYTSARSISNQHRNVLFRGQETVNRPITFFEAPDPLSLWRQLEQECLLRPGGCDVITIPHNANWSNGNLFRPTRDLIDGKEEQADLATLRARIEPLVEMFQHKGDAECRNGLEGINGEEDPHCTFEKMRIGPVEDCGEGTGAAAMIGLGCLSRRDFARSTLLEGLREEAELGVNPWRLGLIGGTDTHNGTPGLTEESLQFPGHLGIDDDSPEERLGYGTLIPGGALANPGGLVAVWAEENSRNSLFDSLQRKEVYGTSGTRIVLRLFGGPDLPAGLCDQQDGVQQADASGVPMGGSLTGIDSSPSFFVTALADVGTEDYPGTPLNRVQIVKGWLDLEGNMNQKVFDIAGGSSEASSLNTDTCLRDGGGSTSLCGQWTDPEWNPSQSAFYYARVLEEPSCRYHTYLCNQIPDTEERPPSCSGEKLPLSIQERAWSSPIWVAPGEDAP